MIRTREHRSLFGRGRVHERLLPRPPQFSHFGICVLFRAKPSDKRTKMNKRTNEQMNKQTNKRTRLFCFALTPPRDHPAVPLIVPCAVMHEKGRLKIEFGFQQNQNLISDFEGCHCGLISVHGGLTTTVLRPQMCSNHRAQQQTGGQRPRALISLYPGQTTRISMARYFAVPRSFARPPWHAHTHPALRRLQQSLAGKPCARHLLWERHIGGVLASVLR